jgi:hypothetical protein
VLSYGRKLWIVVGVCGEGGVIVTFGFVQGLRAFGFVQGLRAHALVMGRRMMLRIVVSAVCTTVFPIHMKLALPYRSRIQ